MIYIFRIGEALEDNTIPEEYLQLPPAFWSKYWRSRVPDTRDSYGGVHGDGNAERDYRDLAFSRTQQLPYVSSARGVALNFFALTMVAIVLTMWNIEFIEKSDWKYSAKRVI